MPVLRVPPEWPLERRLAERSVRDPKTGCLLWTASRNRSGYGHLFWKGVPQLAHRAAWMARHGPIPKGLYVCHRCDVRPCINPDHLFLGTQKDNMIDKALKMGHGRRIEGVPECRPHKAPEIMWVRIGDEEIVARVLDVRRAAGAALRPGCGPNPGSMLALRPGAKRRVKSGRSGEGRSPC